MLKTAVILGSICAAVVLSDFCRHESGTWSSCVVDGANDFATTGVAPNDQYFCWEACLNTAFVNQNFKVNLANPLLAKSQRRVMSYAERKTRAQSRTSSHDDDGDALCCLDPELRSDINTAVKKVTNHSAAAIARTLQYQVARPNWVYNVVELADGFSAAECYTDMNFCDYSVSLGEELYEIRMAAIDKS